MATKKNRRIRTKIKKLRKRPRGRRLKTYRISRGGIRL